MTSLDLSCPVNWTHPLNRGRVGWWLAAPPLPRGNRWQDLVGLSSKKGNPGALTNGPVWQGPRGRPGGYGSIATVAASSQMVDCGTPIGFSSITKAAYCGWIYRASTGTTAGFGGSAGTRGAIGNRFSFLWFTDANLYVTAGSNTYATVSLAGVGWNHIAVSYDDTATGNAARLKTWVNSVPQTLAFTGTIPASIASSGPWTIGRDSSDGYCGGNYDDVSLYLRTISNDEVFQLYQQSRLGHPDTLNWM